MPELLNQSSDQEFVFIIKKHHKYPPLMRIDNFCSLHALLHRSDYTLFIHHEEESMKKNLVGDLTYISSNKNDDALVMVYGCFG